MLPVGRYKRVTDVVTAEEVPTAFTGLYPTLERQRWFVDAPLLHNGDAWVVSKMWGLSTEQALKAMSGLVPGGAVSYESVG